MKKKRMDQKKIVQYQKKLFELKEKFVDDIRQINEHVSPSERSDSGDVSGHVMHLADVATDMYDREFSLGLAANDRETLNKIDQALKKIADGSFGLCDHCQKSIPEIRLKAIPYVEYCLKCQEKSEEHKF